MYWCFHGVSSGSYGIHQIRYPNSWAWDLQPFICISRKPCRCQRLIPTAVSPAMFGVWTVFGRSSKRLVISKLESHLFVVVSHCVFLTMTSIFPWFTKGNHLFGIFFYFGFFRFLPPLYCVVFLLLCCFAFCFFVFLFFVSTFLCCFCVSVFLLLCFFASVFLFICFVFSVFLIFAVYFFRFSLLLFFLLVSLLFCLIASAQLN